MRERDNSVPIESFIQALQTQLDRAQATMALKAKNQGLPLTFAVKDISLDLRAHVEVVESQIRIRPAGPGDADASTLRFSMTTITKPMIEENAIETMAAPDEPTLKEAFGDSLTEDEQRRLEWAGIQTVSQLRGLKEREHVVERVANIPAMRLRAALDRAAQPFIRNVAMERLNDPADNGANQTLLRIRGHNLMRERAPQVRISGEDIQVLKATDKELLIAPLSHQMGGTLLIETAPGSASQTDFDLYPTTPLEAVEEPSNGVKRKKGLEQ